MNIITVASARPNFMKVAPLLEECSTRDNMHVQLLHTGQHYDYEMSKIFFDEIGIPEPDFHLGVGSGSHAQQTARVMTEFDQILEREQPDWVIVVGDVNPTMACTITAVKRHIKVAHVEAGLRSRDRNMPEEINRILTDSIADLLLTPSIDGNMNLAAEGIPQEKIHFAGNIMIDTLFNMRAKAEQSTMLDELEIDANAYFLVTLHRPSNVDHRDSFEQMTGVLEYAAEQHPVVWPMHPRARKKAEAFGLLDRLEENARVILREPMGYLDNICLMQHARLVLTDSGGIQEETTALGVPCLTIRENTERPITIDEGTNTLAGTDPQVICSLIDENLQRTGSIDASKAPLYWDGHTAGRIIDAIAGYDG